MNSFHIKRFFIPLVPLLAACHGGKVDTASVVPTGLEPIEDKNLADAPGAKDGDDYPEELNLVGGEGDDYDWAHGRGYLHGSVSDVWAALATPEVVVDRRRVQEWTVETDVDPDYDVSFVLHETSHDIVTVEFDVTWIQGRLAGEEDAPTSVGGRWTKTDGTDLVYLLQGSVLLDEVEAEVTEIQLIEHLSTPGSDSSDIELVLNGLFDSLKATIHGEPLPTYEE